MSQNNQTSTLETFHLIDTLYEKFSIDDIRTFYNEHDMRDKKILFMGEETLSLSDIFRENENLAAALPANKSLLGMAVSDIMALDVSIHHLTEIVDVANARKQEILAHISSQGIRCTTAAIFAILLNMEDNVSIENVEFERLEAIFCIDCLVRYSMSHSGFQNRYVRFLADRWRFNEIIRVADTCTIPFSMFRPFSIFSALELYLLYLKRKTIMNGDAIEVRNLVSRLKHLSERKKQVDDGVSSMENTCKATDSRIFQTLESLCLAKEGDISEICRDLVGIVLEKRSDNGLLKTRECIESMLLLKEGDNLMYGVRRYMRHIVKYGISLCTKMQEIQDARAVLAFVEAAKKKNVHLCKRSVYGGTAEDKVVLEGLIEKNTEVTAKNDVDVQCVPLLNDYSWLEEDEKTVLLEAYKGAYPPEKLSALAEVCRLGSDCNAPDVRGPLRFLLNASRQNTINTDVVNEKIYALTHREKIEFVHQAQSLENFKPWFCFRKPTLNVSRECAATFLKKISDPIETLYTMKENLECIFSLTDAYDPLVILPLILSILERGEVSSEFIMETQRYLIHTVLKDNFFAEENLVSIKRIVDLVLCADLEKRHRAVIERNCDEIIGLLKKLAVLFDKRIFVRNIK
eukprot:jgi/Antlo1/1610/472